MNKLKQVEKYLQANRPQTVISGGSLGWDAWLAWVALRLKIPLVFYIPFEGFHSRWSDEHQKQFRWLLERAQHVDYVCEPGYAAWKMHRRNEAMIRDSELVLALWNPEKKYGGTFSTVAHASTVGRPILNFWHDPAKPVDLITKGE